MELKNEINTHSYDSSHDAVVQRLRQAVKAAGGNQLVADLSGIPLSTLNDYLKGNEVKFARMAKLAGACKVSLNWLWEGREEFTQSQTMGKSFGFTDRMLTEPVHFMALAILLATCQEFYAKTNQTASLAETFEWISPHYDQAKMFPNTQIRLKKEDDS